MATVPTPIIRVIAQRHIGDCSVACLAMLLQVSYEEALLAFEPKRVITKGAYVSAVKTAARRLKRTLRQRRKFDLEEDTGILVITFTDGGPRHVVVLKEGLIIDTDSTVWDADMYMTAKDATGTSLLTLEDA